MEELKELELSEHALPTAAAASPAFQIYEIKNFYMLVYRHGLNSNLIKIFYHQGNLRSAHDRAKQHCEILKYKLLYVKPLISSLDEEEREHLGQIS